MADKITAFSQDLATRTAEDLTRPEELDDEAPGLSDAKTVFDKLAATFSSVPVKVVSQKELFRADYASKQTAQERQEVLNNYLNGTEQRRGT